MYARMRGVMSVRRRVPSPRRRVLRWCLRSAAGVRIAGVGVEGADVGEGGAQVLCAVALLVDDRLLVGYTGERDCSLRVDAALHDGLWRGDMAQVGARP